MNVLLLAIGGTRRPAIIAETEQALAQGGAVTVLVDDASRWRLTPLPAGADLVELSRLVHGYRPAAVRLLLSRVPLYLLRVGLPGPLREVSKRLRASYRRRVIRPVDRRLARRYDRNPVRVRRRAIARDLLRDRSVGLVVVGNPESMVIASELRDMVVRSGVRLAYTAAHAYPGESEG